MIYYPLSVLMLADLRDILIISTPHDLPQFRRLIGDGSHLGLRIDYAEQPKPNGIAEAFVIGAELIGDDSVALVLGDNIFHGHSSSEVLRQEREKLDGCLLFSYEVHDPERYGVGETDENGMLVSTEEKPARPRSDRAITGLYFYDNGVVARAAALRPSARGELEITDLNRMYMEHGRARLRELGRGFTWLDTGTPESLLQAAQYVRTLEERQGVRIAYVEEVALRRGFIGPEECHRLGALLGNSDYGRYVMAIAGEHPAAGRGLRLGLPGRLRGGARRRVPAPSTRAGRTPPGIRRRRRRPGTRPG
ncbi:glucose-1-phosphate thymidylyltransferase RfbA [Streptomyces sanglieri]